MGASIGLVDGARISPDVAPFWQPAGQARDAARSRMSEPSALNAIRNTITRWWMHGRLWQSDPDCLLLRDSETALTLDEVRTLATVIAMSGGMVLDSDDLTRLSDERRKWLSMLFPAYGKAARPLDLFDSEMPRLLELDIGSHRMVAVLNWAEKAATVEVPLPDGVVQVFDSWSRENLGVREGSLALELPAHGCRLLTVMRVVRELATDIRNLPPLFRWAED
jgi:alpha-galactosidase